MPSTVFPQKSILNAESTALAWALAIYGCFLFSVCTLPPLWLDEILDLIAVKDLQQSGSLHLIQENAGSAPLGYFAQLLSVELLGYGQLGGRFVSMTASVASCIGMYLIAKRAGSRLPVLGAVLLSVIPLQFRYALEARPYSLALCLSIWLTVILDQVVATKRYSLFVVYGTLTLGAILTQPYAAFVPIGHIAWAFSWRTKPSHTLSRSLLLATILAFVAAVPWYAAARVVYVNSPHSALVHYRFSYRDSLLILRELVGLGYLGTALTFAALGLTIRTSTSDKAGRWLLAVTVPVIGAIVLDATFGYFLAIRQMIFALPALVVSFVVGLETLYSRHKTMCILLWIAMALGCMRADYLFLTRPREDWRKAAKALVDYPSNRSCVAFSPANYLPLFAFFEPAVTKRLCPQDLSSIDVVLVATSEPASTCQAYLDQMQKSGFLRRENLRFGGPTVRIMTR